MKNNHSVSLLTYFKQEKKLLILTSVTGIIYNVGLAAGPLLEGQLAQYLYDILKGVRAAKDIIILSLIYVMVIAIVQGARALKRLYVRKFANNVSRSMKERIYHHLVHESYAQVQQEDAGAVMTRAIADAEACAEGMRKFTTEVFDTGVVMISYLVTLFLLDGRLTLIVILFPPIAYITSAALKKKVARSASESKIAMSNLNNAAVDAASHALTYRVYGEDTNRSAAYETVLADYEKKNIAAGIWQNSPQPVYLVISMIGVIPILYFGGRNVLDAGWTFWTIASFSSFLSCFTRLATKSSHAAKLFNAIQKAQVSWKRIQEYLTEDEEGGINNISKIVSSERKDAEGIGVEKTSAENSEKIYAEGSRLKKKSLDENGTNRRNGEKEYPTVLSASCAHAGSRPAHAAAPAVLRMEQVSFSYEDGSFSLHDLNFCAHPGEIIGITGKVASGKSTFGKLFLNEYPYEGDILYGGRRLPDPSDPEYRQSPLIFAYAGHDPELFTGSVRENITFGRCNEARLKQVLSEVQIDGEVTGDTMVGMEGGELSGGQQARVSLARALYSRAPVLILDDPFSAVDTDTEVRIFESLRTHEKWRTILLISHRLAMFPRMDQIIFLENGSLRSGSHQQMLQNDGYASLYALQHTGIPEEEKT